MPVQETQRTSRGEAFLAKGARWERDIPAGARAAISERALRLPAWAVGDPAGDGLDVERLRGRQGFFRLRVGRYRAIFQRLGRHVVVHRIDSRDDSYEDYKLAGLRLVRAHDGLRTLRVAEPHESPPAPSPRPAPRQRAQRPEIVNPLTPFTAADLSGLGLTADAIEELRRLPADLLPDGTLAAHRVDPEVTVLLAELWERPEHYLARVAAGEPLTPALVELPESEAEQRLEATVSSSSLIAFEDAESLAAVLALPIEDWMLYLHPAQQRLVDIGMDGPMRIRGGAGTGKTVVALHRARALARTGRGRVLVTTFVTTLPRTWQTLFQTFAGDVRGRLDIRTVDALALDIYRDGGGWMEVAEDSWLDATVREIHDGAGQLSALALREEFDYMLTGRRVESLEQYLALPRTGRGTPLGEAARRAVWAAYETYRKRLDEAGVLGFHELRAEALTMIETGAVRRRYAAVVVDEAQDLTETGVRLLAAVAGPNVTFVGDGQQSIYPGGFSLRSLGVDVRGRSFVLRVNWRNTFAIWLAAEAFIAGDTFDDLEELEQTQRAAEESPYPLRDGESPRLHVFGGDPANWLVELVEADLRAGADPGDCAVLAPTNSTARTLETTLRRAGVPVASLERYAGEHRGQVWAGTFHRAKGLEFKRVYVAGLDPPGWPPSIPGYDTAAQSEADRRAHRAAFVAFTRARDSLDVVLGQAPGGALDRAAWAFDRV